MSVAIPSYIRPDHYTTNGSSYMHNNVAPYIEYGREVDYLAGPESHANDSGYWENMKNDAVRYIGDQAAQCVPQSFVQFSLLKCTRSSFGYSAPSRWIPPTTGPSSAYQTNAFAQSIFQRTTPSTAYPTPPPPGITNSSSSLAYALGRPIPSPKPPVYRPEDSTQFFNNFLEQKFHELDPPRPTTPTRHKFQEPQESPDPLALGYPNAAPFSVPALTPRKRKPGAHTETPSLKRVQSNTLATLHKPLTPLTPTSSQTLKATTSASKSARKLEPYVEVPPLPTVWLTPSRSASQKSLTSLSKKMQSNMKVHDTPDDLGGYGSVDDDEYSAPRFESSGVKSSARRTGDRDDRGMSVGLPLRIYLS